LKDKSENGILNNWEEILIVQLNPKATIEIITDLEEEL